MSTSGSYDFSVSRDDIIKDAYDEIGVLEEGETPNAEMTTTAARKLNMLVKRWMTQGHHLWCIQDAALFLVLGQTYYSLGNAATDANWCDPTDMAQTETTVDAAAGAGTITLTSVSGIAASDKIGIVLDSGDIQWTTVNGAPAGLVVTLGAVLTGAAAAGAVVFAYTTRLVRPLRIVPDCLYLRDTNDNDQPVELIAKAEYDLMTAKTQRGGIIQAAYEPLLTSGRLWTWPTADLATKTLRFSFERPIQDFDLTTDNPDFPVEWSMALYQNLAVLLAPGQGAIEELGWLKPAAKESLDDALDFDRGNAPVKFQPDLRNYRSRR